MGGLRNILGAFGGFSCLEWHWQWQLCMHCNTCGRYTRLERNTKYTGIWTQVWFNYSILFFFYWTVHDKQKRLKNENILSELTLILYLPTHPRRQLVLVFTFFLSCGLSFDLESYTFWLVIIYFSSTNLHCIEINRLDLKAKCILHNEIGHKIQATQQILSSTTSSKAELALSYSDLNF